MRVSAISICLLLVCIYRTANAGRRLRPRILEGEGINFPRRTLSKTQAANCVFSKRLFSIYRIANPPFGPDDNRDLELVYEPRADDDNLDKSWDARFGGVCTGGELLYEPAPGEGSRAVYTSGRRPRPGLLDGDGINFPRRTLSRTQFANCVFNKRLFSIYRISNPQFGTGVTRDLELVYRPGTNCSLYESGDARYGGVCLSDEWLYECIPGEGNRAVYTYDGPFPTTGQGITSSFFSSHPRDYIFHFACLDRTKEEVSTMGRVLKKLQEDQGEAVVICPLWATQPWFPLLLGMIVEDSYILPQTNKLLYIPQYPSQFFLLMNRNGKRVFCGGPWTVVFLTYEFPPNRVKWCAAERDLWKTLCLTFDHERSRFDPTFERCNQEPFLL